MLDPDLVRRINAGRCFAFVGSGPSSEIGYASWRYLAEGVRDRVLQSIPDADLETYERFLTDGVKGRANCTTCGRVKVYHLSEGIGQLVGSWIPVSGIIKEPISGQRTQDGNRNFNTDIT